MRRTALAIALMLGLAAPVAAQAPPPVPALPDTARVTTYNLNASTCACSVGFDLYGSGTDVNQWISVYVNGVAKLSTDPTYGWGLTSATGSLGAIPRPITNAVLTFTSPQTASIIIVGNQRPRRLSQFSENRGVPARDLNQVITTDVAGLRELWDKSNRSIVGLPGEVFQTLPAAALRANNLLGFDSAGLPAVVLATDPGAAILATMPPFTTICNPTGITAAAIACPAITAVSPLQISGSTLSISGTTYPGSVFTIAGQSVGNQTFLNLRDSAATNIFQFQQVSNYARIATSVPNAQFWFNQSIGFSNATGIFNVNAGGGILFQSDGSILQSGTAVSGMLSTTFANAVTIASGACGTGTNGSISGVMQAGIITIGASATTVCTVSYTSMTTPPRQCQLTPANALAATVPAAGAVWYWVSTPGATSWTINGAALASTTWSYLCI